MSNMLQPSPEYQRSLDNGSVDPVEMMPMSPLDPIETKASFLEFRRADAIRRTMATVAGVAFIGANVGLYAADVHANQEIQASARVEVNILSQALDPINDDNALVSIDGFGMRDGEMLASSLGIGVRSILDGQIWQVNYNDASLEPLAIAEEIVETATEEGVDTISLVANSAGGGIAMQTQERIHEISDLTVEAVFLNASPDGVKTLRPARREEVALVEQYAWIPGVTYSTPLRAIGEIAFQADRYSSGDPATRFNNFVRTAEQVSDALHNNKLPGTWLMIDQMLAIENANIKTRVQNLNELPEETMRPTIIYLSAKKDYMVNNELAVKNIESYTNKYGVPFLTYDIPGAIHSRPDLSKDEYVAVLASAKEDILESIDAQRALAKYNQTLKLELLAEELAEHTDPNDQIGIPNPQQLSDFDGPSVDTVVDTPH